MIDTGVGSSYICSELITKLQLSPVRQEIRCIEQMYGTVTKRVELYSVNIQSSVIDEFSLNVQCINAEKEVLTYLPNPRIKELNRMYPRLRRLQLSDEETSSDELPVHIIVGAADYQRIRSTEQPILGKNPDKDPDAELTMLGWIIYGRLISDSHRVEKQFFPKSSQSEFDRLCTLDVLGLVDTATPESSFHEDFTEQLKFTNEGHYETQLPWKVDHGDLPSNKELALARLRGTTWRLEKEGRLSEYDVIMQEQIQNGILEPVPTRLTGDMVRYIPHHPVIRDEAESTKTWIVYDCSAKANKELPSLNDCLDTGPSLQPLLFDILMRNRMKRLCITGDIEKAFHQIRIQEKDRDAQRVLWYNKLEEQNVVEYRFTRVIFGAAPSPYILGATLHKHLLRYQEQFPDTTQALADDTYVDDIQDGGDNEQALTRFKTEATQIMQEGGFTLHKWHSNVPALESTSKPGTTDIDSAATKTKLLGTPWDKSADELSVDFKPCYKVTGLMTKRKMLASINAIYDILGLVSPVVITGKIIFSEVCSRKISWDELLPDDIVQQGNRWINSLKKGQTVTIPRSVVDHSKGEMSLHGFSDASKCAVCAAVYVISKYFDGSASQNLLVSRSGIAPKETSIPRLELVAAFTLAKLMDHTRRTLHAYTFAENHMWVDSITILYWLASKGK